MQNSLGKIRLLWQKNGNQGEDWNLAEIDLTIEPPHSMIVIEGEVIDWKYGDIAIDDIEYKNGPCKGKLKIYAHFLIK